MAKMSKKFDNQAQTFRVYRNMVLLIAPTENF